ncbi:heme-binding domain-containing protein [Paludibaculum fermentans]|uniref:heme-binding domain-containing protein n=1 Tax=Paludibaculum fermentans TaxID=1473598 RepID=UPI003EB9E2CB
MPSAFRRAVFPILVAGVAVFACLQFLRPELTNPPVTSELQAPPEVRNILRTACYNCHSNETQLAWFDQIVPAYWLVVQDVKTARSHLNFSELGLQPAAKQRGVLYEAISQVQLGAMPLPAYRRLHPEAVVTEQQLAVLRKYVSSLTPPAGAAEAAIAAADQQFARWAAAAGAAPKPAASPNGIEFLPEYKNWKAISATERFDNQSMRVIVGNEIAVKAIAENRIHPWPDGSAMAKIAWSQLKDRAGQVRTGAFQQVEFIIRDSRKYAATKGWGWARWVGTELKPYGKGSSFTGECVSCHEPVSANDYVYTAPVRGQQ